MSWLPKQTVVVPIDFSAEADGAVATARELVADPGHLHLVHVLPVLEPTEPGVIWRTVDNQSRTQHAEQAMAERYADVTGFQAAVRFGNPGHEVAEYAEQIGADLIVVPSHGRTGLGRVLLGSVAERIVRLSHCPVLVLRK